MSKRNNRRQRKEGFVESRSSQYVAPGDHAFKLLEVFRGLVRTSSLVPRAGQFCSLLRTALEIVQEVGNVLDQKFWQRTESVPDRRKTVMQKGQLIRERRAMCHAHERRLRSKGATLDQVCKAMDFARKQSRIMLVEFAYGLMVGELTVPDQVRLRCAWTLVALTDGFRSMWRPVRRDVMSRCRRRLSHGM
jgi:hypothetical protein